MIEEKNVPTTAENLLEERLSHKCFSGKFGQTILCTPKHFATATSMYKQRFTILGSKSLNRISEVFKNVY